MPRINKKSKLVPDMGKIVLKLMADKNISQREMAKKIGWEFSGFNKLLTRSNWNMYDLQEVGKALQVDLLVYLRPTPPEPMVPESLLTAEKEKTTQLEKELQETTLALHIAKAQLEVALKMGGSKD